MIERGTTDLSIYSPDHIYWMYAIIDKIRLKLFEEYQASGATIDKDFLEDARKIASDKFNEICENNPDLHHQEKNYLFWQAFNG